MFVGRIQINDRKAIPLMKKILNYIWRGWMIVLGAVLTMTLGIPVLLFSIRKDHYKYAYKFIRDSAMNSKNLRTKRSTRTRSMCSFQITPHLWM